MEFTAALVLILMGVLLIGGVVGWAIRDRRKPKYIDLRDRIEPHVRAPQDQIRMVRERQKV